MRFKNYLNDIVTKIDLIEIRQQPPITIKLKKIKDPISRIISYETEDGNFKIVPSMSRFESDTKGNPKPIYKIWNDTLKVPQFLPYEYKTLKKAKGALQSIIKRVTKIDELAMRKGTKIFVS